jgi:hypothetical protein
MNQGVAPKDRGKDADLRLRDRDLPCLPLSGTCAEPKKTARLCRQCNGNFGVIRLTTAWANERARHNPGLGMMALMPRAA